MCAKADDHRPVSVKVSVPVRPRSFVKHRRVVTYDRKAVGVIDNDVCFKAAMSVCPVVPYDVDSHSQAHIVEKQTVAALEWAYPVGKGKKKRSEMLGDDVFALIVTQGMYKSSLRKVNREIKRQCLSFCFLSLRFYTVLLLSCFVLVFRSVLSILCVMIQPLASLAKGKHITRLCL